MTEILSAYWRFPAWLRLTGIFIVTVAVGLIIDIISAPHHSVDIVFLAVILAVWGIVGTAERSHRRNQKNL